LATTEDTVDTEISDQESDPAPVLRVLRGGEFVAALILVALLAAAPAASGQQSPPSRATAMIGDKSVSVQYSAPSVRGRKIFGAGGLLSGDPTYPAWRAGANAATLFKPEGAIDV